MRHVVVCVVGIALGAITVCPSNAAVLCQKKKSGVVVAREACKKTESLLDLARFGAVGPQGPAGPQGAPGSGSGPVVKDTNGTLVGLLNAGSALRVINGQLFNLDFSRDGFVSESTDQPPNTAFESNDCSGTAYLEYGSDVFTQYTLAGGVLYYPTGAGVQRTIESYLLYGYTSGQCSSTQFGTMPGENGIPQPGGGCCNPWVSLSETTWSIGTTSINSLGLVPPFSVVLP
jgi:hypothetical protein